MKNWRVINNNMIQTTYKWVWLWDNNIGVYCKAEVPGKPWKKLNPDFTHWMPATEFAEAPERAHPVCAGTKVVYGDKAEHTLSIHADSGGNLYAEYSTDLTD